MKNILMLIPAFACSAALAQGEPPLSEAKYHHIILSKWKEQTNPDSIQMIENILQELRDEISGLQTVHFQKLTECGYDHQAMLTFKSIEARDTYLSHPLHARLEELAKSIVEDFTFYNYWE